MSGQTSTNALMTAGNPSTVQLLGDSPSLFNWLNKPSSAGDEFSLKAYSPRINLFPSVSNKITAPVFLF